MWTSADEEERVETSEKPRWSQHDIDVITRELEAKVGGDIPRQAVRQVVTESFEAFAESRVQAFVPILASRRAREVLRQRVRASSGSQGETAAG
jgi:hypothetical protein